MKIMIDDQQVLELNENQLHMLSCRNGGLEKAHEIAAAFIRWVLQQKMNENAAQLYNEWKDKLIARDIKMIPISLEELSALIFSQEDYEDVQPKEQ